MDYLNIEAEKATAMNRYRRLQKLAKMRRLLEILFALAFFSWSSTRLPSVLNLAAQFLVRVYQYLVNPHITFAIGNAIIVAVVLLSRRNNGAANNNADAALDFSDEIIPTTPPTLASETAEVDVEWETAFVDKEMVVTAENATEAQCDAVVTTAVEEEKKVTGRSFKRVKSERVTRQSAPGRILGRSETLSSDERRVITSFDTVDGLSNEEFRRTIEDVIAEHRRALWTQKMYENE